MRALDRLFNPHTIAVFGGQECERVIEQCDKFGFKGQIWPVHPTREDMGGRPCFRSVEELPGIPDAAYVAINRERTLDVVSQLEAIGAGGVVSYAAGFAEADRESTGSRDLQNRLVKAAGEMPLIGPNCYGFINAMERAALWPDQHGLQPCDRGVAILTQSSNIAISMTMQKRGLPIASVLTVGNQAQLGMSILGESLLEDDRITALGIHIEGLDDVKAFERLALRARELKKPIVVIKVGRSEQAQAATLTHTASLAGSDMAHDALFKRLGIARVNSLDAFLETLKLLHCGGGLEGRDILSLSCSGGEAALMADAAVGKPLTYRAFTDEQAAQIKESLGDLVAIANPLDYNTFIWGDWAAMQTMFEAALSPMFAAALFVIDPPRDDRCDPYDWYQALMVFRKAVKLTHARAAIVTSLMENMPEELAIDLMAEGIAPLIGMDSALQAVEAAAQIGAAWRAPAPAKILAPLGVCTQTRMLDEQQSKTELHRAGLNVPHGAQITREDDLSQHLSELSPPYALKALGIAHKSEHDAVKLNLLDEIAVQRAMSDMRDLSDTFLLEEMAPKPQAELIVGVSRDPVVGLMMTIGAGGVLTELMSDTTTLLLPVTEQDIRHALTTIRIGRLLEGYRDTEAADMEALVANILCIATYAALHHEVLEELDVNPLFATQFGSVAVDALIVKRT